jgi:arsenite-transporting ATPase
LFGPGRHDPAAVLHDAITQELEVSERGARLRLALPLARKGDISLRKIGLELIVGVNGQKRTITLPSPLVGFEPAAARFENGTLEVTFHGSTRPQAAADGR